MHRQRREAGAFLDEGECAAYRDHVGNRRLDSRAFGLLVTVLALIGAAFMWRRRRGWTDHDVSDPGVTL
jgi:hypothetical protein